MPSREAEVKHSPEAFSSWGNMGQSDGSVSGAGGHPALIEELDSDPSIQIRWFTTTCNSAPKGSNAYGLLRPAALMCAHPDPKYTQLKMKGGVTG